MNKFFDKILGVLFFYFACIALSYADHAAGGEITYQCLGNDQYRIKYVFFRDCRGIPLPTTARINIYDNAGNRLQVANLPQTNTTTINGTPPTPCTIIPNNVCLEIGEYEQVVVLPPIPGGYTLEFSTCCRNAGIVNGPEREVAYFATIPDASVVACNNNAVFRDWPPVYICQGDTFSFDNSATDADGDSLVYELCTPYESIVPLRAYPFNAPYSASNPLGGSSPLTIDPQTGLLSGVPPTSGKFVVGVCVREYRNGNLIATSSRDFQLNVVECQPVTFSEAVSATTNCQTAEVTFFNTSSGASSYLWDFGDGSPTSTDENPVHTYSAYGSYTATLIAFNAGTPACNDTNTIVVQVDTCRPCGMTAVVTPVQGVCDPQQGCAQVTWEHPCGTNYSFAYGGNSISSSCGSGGGGSSPGLAPFFTSISASVDGVTIPNASTIETIVITGPDSTCSLNYSTSFSGGNITLQFNAVYEEPQTGGASIAISGGTPPYDIQWTTSPALTGDTIREVEPGVYNAIVTDANGCIEIVPFVIGGVSSMNLAMSSTDITTCGANDGTASVVVTNNNGAPRYLWSPGGFTTASVTGLAPGTYNVEVTDDDCSTVGTVTINDVANVQVAINVTDITCPDETNGSATVTSTTGGAAPYTYAWNTSPVQTGATATGLSFGFYTVVATDQNGCQGNRSFSITGPVATKTSITKTDNTCAAADDGTATISISDGTAPYGVLWGTTPPQSSFTAINLEGDQFHYVTVTDANNCVTFDSVFIAEPPHMHIDLLDLSEVDCAGNFNGVIKANITGGYPNLLDETIIYNEQFNTNDLEIDCDSWFTDVSNAGTNTILNNGDFFRTRNNRFEAQDLRGEGVWRSQEIDISTEANVTISGDFFECGFMENTDYIRAYYSINGGPEILWFDLTDDGTPDCSINTPSLGGLSGNTIQIIVRINNGSGELHRFDNINVTGNVSGVLYNEPFNTNDLWNDPNCAWTRDVSSVGNSRINGDATADHVETRGGVMEFRDVDGEVVWFSNSINIGACNSISVLADVSYSGFMSATEYIRLFYSIDGGAEILWGDHTGSTATAWPGGMSASDSIIGLSGSTIQIIARVNNTGSSDIHRLDNVRIRCAQLNDVPYSLSWSCTPATTDSVFGLAAGVCSLTATDSIGCTATNSIELINTGSMSITTASRPSCGSTSTGIAEARVSGGNLPYSYTWSCSAGTTQAINGLAGGSTCNLTVTDANGCTISPAAINIGTAPDFTLDTILDPGTCNNDGTIDLEVIGGSPAFTYSWNTGQTTQDISSLNTNTFYRVAVFDANSCLKSLDLFLDSSCLILPIENLELKGKPVQKRNHLVWTTGMEINNDFFVLQKSPNAVRWSELGKIDGAGNSVQLLSYDYWDDTPYTTTYYRLKQVDFDGSFSYSNTIVLNNNLNLEAGISIYPNPATNTFTVAIPHLIDPNIRIFNAIGQELHLQISNTNKHEIKFDSQQLAAGVYWIQISHKDIQTTKKLIVKKK